MPRTNPLLTIKGSRPATTPRRMYQRALKRGAVAVAEEEADEEAHEGWVDPSPPSGIFPPRMVRPTPALAHPRLGWETPRHVECMYVIILLVWICSLVFSIVFGSIGYSANELGMIRAAVVSACICILSSIGFLCSPFGREWVYFCWLCLQDRETCACICRVIGIIFAIAAIVALLIYGSYVVIPHPK